MNIHEALQDKTKRYELCKHSLYLFAIYYFGKYFTHISPEFHKDRCKIKQRLGKVWEPRYMVDKKEVVNTNTNLEYQVDDSEEMQELLKNNKLI